MAAFVTKDVEGAKGVSEATTAIAKGAVTSGS